MRGRGSDVVLLVASTLRNLGDTSEARKMAEGAYEKESDQTRKHQIASFRALLRVDIDDEIAWLSRANVDETNVQASLAYARGNKARFDGNDAEAKAQYGRAIVLYDKMPENASSLNNSALVHFALFAVTQERSEFTRGTDKLDRAIALQPSDSILLHNGASTVTEGAFVEVIGPAIDFRLLKQPAGWDSLAYLYRGAAERNPVLDRVVKHPGVVKARTYAEKLLILAPKRDESYSVLAAIHSFARDLEGLKAVLARLEKADLDHGDSEREIREFVSGASDAKRGDEIRKGLARATEALAATKDRKDRTFAAAVGRYVRSAMMAWWYGTAVDADKLVKLADEAHAAAPSDGTEATLSSALAFRAHLALARADKEYAALAERTKRSVGWSLAYHVLATDGAAPRESGGQCRREENRGPQPGGIRARPGGDRGADVARGPGGSPVRGRVGRREGEGERAPARPPQDRSAARAPVAEPGPRGILGASPRRKGGRWQEGPRRSEGPADPTAVSAGSRDCAGPKSDRTRGTPRAAPTSWALVSPRPSPAPRAGTACGRP